MVAEYGKVKIEKFETADLTFGRGGLYVSTIEIVSTSLRKQIIGYEG